MGLALACINKDTILYVRFLTSVKRKNRYFKSHNKVICPTDVHPDESKVQYSVAKRLNKETLIFILTNMITYQIPRHIMKQGPEIWKQTNGKITHFVVGVGTGGTISGIAKFLKEKPNIKIWGVDTYGSVFKFHRLVSLMKLSICNRRHGRHYTS